MLPSFLLTCWFLLNSAHYYLTEDTMESHSIIFHTTNLHYIHFYCLVFKFILVAFTFAHILKYFWFHVALFFKWARTSFFQEKYVFMKINHYPYSIYPWYNLSFILSEIVVKVQSWIIIKPLDLPRMENLAFYFALFHPFQSLHQWKKYHQFSRCF